MEQRAAKELQKEFSMMPAMVLTRDNIATVRQQMDEGIATLMPPVDIEGITHTTQSIPGPAGDPDVTVHIYEPTARTTARPIILHIHGGGYIIGSPEMEQGIVKQMAHDHQAVVVSVQYRLAPEHPYSQGVEECYAALEWIATQQQTLHIDLSHLVVYGGSAGGGLTAAVSLLARDRKGPNIAFQIPLYPMINNRCSLPSNDEIMDDRVWNGEQNRRAWEMYLGEDYLAPASPYAAPLWAEDYSGLPPTFTFVGDLDPFRDETIEYVQRLSQAGVPTEFYLIPGAYHGFDMMAQRSRVH